MDSKFAENLKLARKARGITQKEVAEKIGVSNSSYCFYESGDREPSLSTIEKIAHVLYISIDELFGLYNFGTENLIKEASEAYRTRASCTWQQFYDLPDGEQAELINGQLYYMGAPSRVHQELVSVLSFHIMNYIKAKKGKYKVYTSPFTVKLSELDHTIVHPDISIICDHDKLDERGCNGGPDMVIEIVSPSTKKRDYIEKLKLYSDHEVSEYWIVDPEKEKVMVYQLAEDNVIPILYRFQDTIKVKIFNGLEITISELFEQL